MACTGWPDAMQALKLNSSVDACSRPALCHRKYPQSLQKLKRCTSQAGSAGQPQQTRATFPLWRTKSRREKDDLRRRCSPGDDFDGALEVAAGSEPSNGSSFSGSGGSDLSVSTFVEPIGEEGSPTEFLRKLFSTAQEEFVRARLRSEQLESIAQQVAEDAIAKKDIVTSEEAEASQTVGLLEKNREEERDAEEALLRAEDEFGVAEEVVSEAHTELGAALRAAQNWEGGELPEDVGRDLRDEEGQVERSLHGASVSAWQAAYDQAGSELNLKEQVMVETKLQVQKCRALCTQYELEARVKQQAADVARIQSDAAEALVGDAMAAAEAAVARELEASQRLNDAEIALCKTEKLEAELEEAAAAVAAAKKKERLAAEIAAALAAAQEVVVELVEKLDVQRVREVEVPLPPLPTVQAFAAPTEMPSTPEPKTETSKSKADASTSTSEGSTTENESAAEPKAVFMSEIEETPSRSDSSPSKSSTKKSSRFYAASYFSSADDSEFSAGAVLPNIVRAVKKQLPIWLGAVALVVLGGTVLNHRMETRGVPSGTDATSSQHVASTGRPLVTELKKLPSRVKKMIDKLPRNEPNEEETQLFDVLWLLLASVVFVPIFSKLPGGSPVLGYLAAGALIGPYALSIIQHVHGTKALAEFGVVFLMFNIGLELSLERLRSMRKFVFGMGSAQTGLTALAVGFFAHFVTHTTGPAAIVIGCGLALSSTAVVLQVLQDRGESTSRHGRATFSALLFQDLAVVVLLILIPLLSPQSSKGGVGFSAIAEALGLAAVKAVVAITGIIAGGRLLLRPVYRRMAEGHNSEIFAALTLLVVLGTSVLTARAGLSMALGAFLAGLLLAETEYALQVESDINPYRGLLLGLFFMTVGMSIDPKLLVAKFPLILGAIALLISGKTVLVWAVGRAFGLSTFAAIRTGLLLAPGGEFAFVAFGEAVNSGIMTPQMSSFLFLIVGLSMAITPWLAAGGALLAARFDQQDMRSLQPAEAETDDLQGHIIICGFGRVGQIIAQLLSERLIPFVALDARSERVSAGRALGLPVYFGDAGSRDVLHKVGAERAAAAVITLDTPGANYRTVWALTKNFPNIKTFVRAHDVDHGINLEKAGATAVVPETLEPSLQLAAAVLAEAKLPAAEIAATLDEFRLRHLSELRELSDSSGASLGYGFTRILVKKQTPLSDTGVVDLLATSVPEDGGMGVVVT